MSGIKQSDQGTSLLLGLFLEGGGYESPKRSLSYTAKLQNPAPTQKSTTRKWTTRKV